MWQKGKYGLYSNWKMYLHDETGYYVGLDCGSESALGFRYEGGWSTGKKEYEGAALVAPLPVLFWEKEE